MHDPESGPQSAPKSGTQSSARLPGKDTAERKTTSWAVRRLTLTDFRNYSTLRLEPDPCPVVLTGANGAGKTNLLEALSYLAPGRGLRGVRLGEVTRRDAEPGTVWAVAATLDTPAGPVDLGTGLEPDEDSAENRDTGQSDNGNKRQNSGARRVVHINGQSARPGALGEWGSSVWLTPDMDRLFCESAGSRRRFLDRIVAGFDPGHATRTSSYERILRERARLLREKGGHADPAWLDALEETLAQTGIAIACARREMAALLNCACEQNHGPFPMPRVEATGDVESWLDQGPALDAEERFHAALAETRGHDAESGRTAHGPHRSDLEVHMRVGESAAEAASEVIARECSTGEQKGLLISILLAVAELIRGARGAAPLLLLDEVAAHLDEERRAALFERLGALGAQAWLTGTDPAQFAGLSGRAHFYHVADGAAAAV
ncbi:MAG: DNA replication/repair protein RecF [Alphaproteobacteria bacterium]|nr:DNA replication/repair protein RecF [Alphaproteobacteria bacterium]